jgi:hypothetical protein
MTKVDRREPRNRSAIRDFVVCVARQGITCIPQETHIKHDFAACV